MSDPDIDHLVDCFVLSAKVAHRAGVEGVEPHAGHGCLLSQSILEKSNRRADECGGKLYLLRQIASGIRRNTPKDIVLGVELNSADFIDGKAVSSSDEKAMQHVGDIVSWELIDSPEISGEGYENPEFMVSVSKRQAFSSRFSRKFHECLPRGRKSPLADFTGGLRTYATINSALGNGHAEPVGIGRLPIHDPHVPIRLKSEKHDYVPPPAPDYTASVLDRLFVFLGSQGPGVDGCWPKMYWYTV